MATATKLLLASYFLLILLTANCQTCDNSSLEILITNTGQRVGTSDFVFEVSVKNKCQCTVVNVFLDSLGFTSVTPVDPKQFRKEGTGYLINDGRRPLLQYEESLTEQELKDIIVGEACADLRHQLDVSYPVSNGIVQNWEDFTTD